MRSLEIVCTPIGNLEDLAPRAAQALVAAEVVLAEDTRHTRPLLDRIGSKAKLVSCHQHNEEERVDLVVELVSADRAVCLVTDAGAPGVSDPGGRLVDAVIARGVSVSVLPGPSAVVAALMGAGLDTSRFAFLGFLPKRGKARDEIVRAAARAGLALVVFEAANRTQDTLGDLHSSLGARRVVVARELTKLHETFHRGVLGGELAPAFVTRGEVVIVVEAGVVEQAPVAAADVAAALDDESLSPKERAKRLGKALGISTKEAYERLRADRSDV